jgi:hypothetical protein
MKINVTYKPVNSTKRKRKSWVYLTRYTLLERLYFLHTNLCRNSAARRNIPVTSGKELSPKVDKIRAEYLNKLLVEPKEERFEEAFC